MTSNKKVSVSLGQLVTVHYGRGLPQKQRRNGEIPVYGANGIIGFHSVSLTRGPTIVIGRKGAAGRVHWSDNACWPIDTTFFIDEFPETIFPKFLYYCLLSRQNEFSCQATTIPSLSLASLLEISVFLPDPDNPSRSLLKQRQIVFCLDEMFAEIQNVIALAKKTQESVKCLERALLDTFF